MQQQQTQDQQQQWQAHPNDSNGSNVNGSNGSNVIGSKHTPLSDTEINGQQPAVPPPFKHARQEQYALLFPAREGRREAGDERRRETGDERQERQPLQQRQREDAPLSKKQKPAEREEGQEGGGGSHSQHVCAADMVRP